MAPVAAEINTGLRATWVTLFLGVGQKHLGGQAGLGSLHWGLVHWKMWPCPRVGLGAWPVSTLPALVHPSGSVLMLSGLYF